MLWKLILLRELTWNALKLSDLGTGDREGVKYSAHHDLFMNLEMSKLILLEPMNMRFEESSEMHVGQGVPRNLFRKRFGGSRATVWTMVPQVAKPSLRGSVFFCFYVNDGIFDVHPVRGDGDVNCSSTRSVGSRLTEDQTIARIPWVCCSRQLTRPDPVQHLTHSAKEYFRNQMPIIGEGAINNLHFSKQMSRISRSRHVDKAPDVVCRKEAWGGVFDESPIA